MGLGRIHASIEGRTVELRLAQWTNGNTATLAEDEVVELIARLTSALAVIRAQVDPDEEFA